jgi:hypothetical protein
VINASDNDANLFTHIGFHHNTASSVGTITGAVTGAIDVKAHEGGLTMNAGDAAGAFVQIGHGGTGSFNRAVDATIDISFCETGDVTMNAGGIGGTGSYAQIGHGIRVQANTRDGNITLTNFGNLNMNGGAADETFAQIGHGGIGVGGVKTGDITLTGTTTVANQGSITNVAGSAFAAYTQIGHGGRGSNGAVDDSDITIQNVVNLSSTGTVGTAGHVAYNQVGHGGQAAGGNFSGDIDIDLSGSATFAAGTVGSSGWGATSEQYSQLGHGGVAARGDHSGVIDLDTGGDIRFSAGNSLRAYAQLGHGGSETDAPNNDANSDGHSGSILVTTSGGSIVFNGGAAGGSGTVRENYAQLGHGGSFTHGNQSGLIDVDAANGNIEFYGGKSAAGDMHYALLGHGGREARGDHSGQIDVDAQGIIFEGGTRARTWVKLGHGGFEADSANGHSGTINVTTTGATGINFASGNESESFSQLGHGGLRADGDHSLVMVATRLAVTVQAPSTWMLQATSNSTPALAVVVSMSTSDTVDLILMLRMEPRMPVIMAISS